MPAHEGGDEGAAWHDLEALGAGGIQYATRQPRGDALASEGGGDLGMGEGDHAWRQAVIGDRGVVAGVHFEAVLDLVIADDVRHAGLECSNRQYSDPSRIASADALPAK